VGDTTSFSTYTFFCLFSRVSSHEYRNVPSVSSRPEWMSLRRRFRRSGLASRIYKERCWFNSLRMVRTRTRTCRLTSRTESLFSTEIVKSGAPSVKRTTRSREVCSGSGVKPWPEFGWSSAGGSIARCFPLALSLSIALGVNEARLRCGSSPLVKGQDFITILAARSRTC